MKKDMDILKVVERPEKLKNLRKAGFIPCVLNGTGFEKSQPVKVEEAEFNKMRHLHFPNAKAWVEFNKKKHFGMIKQLQKDSLSGRVIHFDIHILNQQDDIRVKLQLAFTGIEELEHKNIELKIHKKEVDVSGKAGLLPEHLVVNVENMKAGDMIQAKDLDLDKSCKIHDPDSEIYAVASAKKTEEKEEPAE
jgi:large subunit ribosomal protein L25